jgi:hypothetical protein
MRKTQAVIQEYYEACLEKYGDDWPNLEDTHKRYDVMLGIISDDSPTTLLDFGCGAVEK